MEPFSFLEKKIAPLRVDDFEIYRIQSRQLALEAKEGEIESSQASLSNGIALRLFRKGRVGFASSADESIACLERMVDLAGQALDAVEVGPSFPLAEGTGSFTQVERDSTLRSRPFKEKEDLVKRLEGEARAYDPRVTRVRGARYEEGEETITLRNSRRFQGGFSRTLCELSLMVMAESGGDQEMSWESYFSPFFQKLDPKWTARKAAEQAISLLGARPISTRQAPALLDPVVGASLIGVLSSSFLGDQVVKGKSSLKDRLGEQVYAKTLSIVDDGLQSDGYGSAPFDGEGTRTGQTRLVEQGVLRSFLHDRASAVRLKQQETGNGVRPTFKELPRTGVTNFFVEPGDRTFDQLQAQMGRGFLITDLIGVHTANPVTGDFSLGASGFWVEKGKQVPVRGITVSGNLHQLFKKVLAVGSDLRFYHEFGCPSLLISEIDIAGT